jgi:tRNA (guanine-N7-)-methyltransferase
MVTEKMSDEPKPTAAEGAVEEKQQNTAVDGSDSGATGNDSTDKNDGTNRRKRKSKGNNSRIAPITNDGDMPQKKFYRQRAHCNPLSHNDNFSYPLRPDLVDWTVKHYPGWEKYKPSTTTADEVVPTVLDIGCGFGGLTVALSTILPNETIMGMEIRAKVTEFVRLRILALRKEVPGSYENASVMRTNSMKFLPNYFRRGRLKKLFFCFPDPHFKRKNHPRRIVSERLLSEYAYFLEPGGKVYTITDVKELHEWHVEKCDAHPLFERIDEKQLAEDPCVKAMINETEEGKKVARNNGSKYYAVYKYRDDLLSGGDKKWSTENFFDSVSEAK